MKRAVVIALLAFILLPAEAQVASAACVRPNCWGAIAINTRTGRWQWTVNHPSRITARRRALNRCGGRCNRSLVFRNSCGAYATPSNFRGGYGWATRRTRPAAQAEALRQCRTHNPGQGCRIRVWACTSRTAAATPPPPPTTGCRAPNCWGAIAVNTRTGRWQWTVNHRSRAFARTRALRRCGGRCNRSLAFRNSCGAYALANNGGWGWATRYNRFAAEAEALRQCRIHNPGRGCRVRVYACTSRRQ